MHLRDPDMQASEELYQKFVRNTCVQQQVRRTTNIKSAILNKLFDYFLIGSWKRRNKVITKWSFSTANRAASIETVMFGWDNRSEKIVT